MAVFHYTNTDRYALFDNTKQQMVYLTTDIGNLQGMWREGEAPYDPEMLPSEVLEILRKPGYVSIGEAAERRNVTIAKIEAELTRLDCEWLTARAEELEKQAKECRGRIDEIKETAS